jgi:hypothetical protein
VSKYSETDSDFLKRVRSLLELVDWEDSESLTNEDLNRLGELAWETEQHETRQRLMNGG